MARGNQRDLARAKNEKKKVEDAKKKGKERTGTQMQHEKESDAEKMRRKQAAGMFNG
ncbi:hypothetical protein FOXG_21273 [Fusarium oxysporum f. sp. lycopersici 4287]|uniref:Uncharacterized protein n=2 Tax=Fusarium oxysporum TaxID=5507 RepID=A0A0J9VW62_FUSO4|nr:hypothetical protein FOXG_21273 [Fusarium oxysporum f. sp. lycopersici 4287]EXA37409.1 hypothetical protein FOVG_11635 [Fusarium oxysporum f. sp. pisi HDV247]KNB15194.1 hypothetical protein FOXG_21273 [Fusarium oxysporum f. sp. lycopersici 4287]